MMPTDAYGFRGIKIHANMPQLLPKTLTSLIYNNNNIY